MGTRGAWGFIVNGKTKAAYNHWDSYPDGLGETVLNFIGTNTIESLTEIANRIQLVDSDNKPSQELQDQYHKFFDGSVSNQTPDEWYCLLRNTQGEPSVYESAEVVHMIDSADFLKDDLFCEHYYLINLDTGMLDYSGYDTHSFPLDKLVGRKSFKRVLNKMNKHDDD